MPEVSPKYITLIQWARKTFGSDCTPHQNTLRNWAKDGKFSPPAKKMGREWFVKTDAEYEEE